MSLPVLVSPGFLLYGDGGWNRAVANEVKLPNAAGSASPSAAPPPYWSPRHPVLTRVP